MNPINADKSIKSGILKKDVHGACKAEYPGYYKFTEAQLRRTFPETPKSNKARVLVHQKVRIKKRNGQLTVSVEVG